MKIFFLNSSTRLCDFKIEDSQKNPAIAVIYL